MHEMHGCDIRCKSEQTISRLLFVGVPTVMENPGKSWYLKPSWKVTKKLWISTFFQEVMENLYFKETVMEKSWNFAQTISFVHDMWLWCLLVCIYKFTIFLQALSCI